MGHYRADLTCGMCGSLHCSCPLPKLEPNTNFIVTDDFEVVTVKEFDARQPTIINPMFYRMGKKEFKRRHDAEVHARELCEAAVERTRAQLAQLKNILKVRRPWEKK